MNQNALEVEIAVSRPLGSGNWVRVATGIFDPRNEDDPLTLSGDEEIPPAARAHFIEGIWRLLQDPMLTAMTEEVGHEGVRVGDATYRMGLSTAERKQAMTSP